jgi:flagellar hook-associated protein 3 FlgL
MQVRTTSFAQFERAATELRRQQLQSMVFQRQLTSGTRIDRPSDDPAALPAFMSAHRDVQRIEGVLSTLGQVKLQVSGTHEAVRQAQTLLSRAKLIAGDARQSTESAARQVMADEVDDLLQRMLAIANESTEYGYLFSGASPDTQPFVTAADGSIQYVGGADANVVNVDGRNPIDRLLAGSVVFESNVRGVTLFDGDTGALPGVGTDTGRGRAELVVTHTLTTFAAGSGVAAGASSATDDTILGPMGTHVLSIDDVSGTGASGTVRLNGGDPVAFTSGDTDLAVTGPNGEIVHLDMSSITPGFSGSVNVQSGGSLSTDGGLTTTAINFTNGQMVVDSRTSAVTYVDTTGVVATGSEAIEYTGTANVFEALAALRDEILAGQDSNPQEWQEALTRRIDDLTRLEDHLLEIVGSTGVDLEYIETTENEFADLQLAAETTESDLGAVDYADAILRLQQHQFQYQVVLAATSQLFDVSILDFLG